MHTYVGSTLPLPRTQAETAATADPRQSLEKRYGDLDGYAKAVEAAARRLIADGFMLEEDLPRATATALAWWRRLAELRGLAQKQCSPRCPHPNLPPTSWGTEDESAA